MYKTKCPECGEQLYLDSCTVYPVEVPIKENGFNLRDAWDPIQTNNAIVYCKRCEYRGEIEYTEAYAEKGTDND